MILHKTDSFCVLLTPKLQSEWLLKALSISWDAEKNLPVEIFPVGMSEEIDLACTLKNTELNTSQKELLSTMQAFLDNKLQKVEKNSRSLLYHLKGTDFQKKVWRAISEIPAGTVISYQELAKKIHHPNAVRAVGSACGKNPFPFLIPCHRVIASKGIGGYGYGLDLKRKLLKREHVAV